MKEATLYWIRLAEHTDIFTQGYIGVSINHRRRFNEHKKQCDFGTHANPHLSHAFATYGHDKLILEEFFVGPKKECYLKEAELRPNANVGWNIAPGGHNGPNWAKGNASIGGRAALKEQPPRPICGHCNFALSKPNGKSKYGFQKWHKFCEDCARIMYLNRFDHLQHKKNECEGCGFIPKDRIQLDLVFRDGNKKNKKITNLVTLCANCARLYNKNLRTGKKSILNATVDSDTRIS